MINHRRIYAHRGLSQLAPENTLTAIAACADYGVTWFETDVDILRDGTPVLIHDTLLDRTTNRSGSIYDLEATDLPEIDAGSWFGPQYQGQTLPTLAQLVDLMNEKQLNANIELKPHETGKAGCETLITRVLAELARLSPQRKVLISSFSHLLLAEFKRQAPQYPVGLLFDGKITEDWRSIAELSGAEYLHPDQKDLCPNLVKEVREYGLGINVYTVNDAKRINQLFNWGVTGVFTDCAEKFIHLEK